jgi:hypothetical protein
MGQLNLFDRRASSGISVWLRGPSGPSATLHGHKELTEVWNPSFINRETLFAALISEI